MFNHIVVWQVAQRRDRELLETALGQRHFKEVRVARPTRMARLFVSAGDFLVSLGLRLKARYEPVAGESTFSSTAVAR